MADDHPFVFGVATSAYQVEGAADADGRGDSIWDTFCRQPGAIADGSDGSVACDSYHRMTEDLDLVKALGVSHHRFSIAWPRIQPTGRGPANQAGLDHYDRLVDALLARGLTALPTLYHWDLPQALQDKGGWPARDTAYRFADYAQIVHDRLGDRVPVWTTHNEPWCTAFLGHASGAFAPGVRDPALALRAAHHLLLSHALAGAALRAGGAEVGIVLNLAPVLPETPAEQDAATVVDDVQNELWLGALLDGRYPARLPAALHDAALDGDLESIAGSLDWLGVNFYTPLRVGPAVEGGSDQDAYPGAPPFRLAPRGALTAMGWEVHAPSLTTLLTGLAGRAPALPLWVTENGSAYDDARRDADGTVDDQDRIDYLSDHVEATLRARAAGADVRGYLAWTLLDNFEWSRGYAMRFGLVEVEPGTLRRRPKRSYTSYAELVARHTS